MSSARIASVLAAIAVVGGMSLVAAPTATADQVWYQGIGRSSEACPATPEEDAEAGWTDWQPSWDAWPNDGNGGDVCNRSITWLYEPIASTPIDIPAGVGCTKIDSLYAQFGGSWKLGAGATRYTKSNCTKPDGGKFARDYVIAPSGYDANALCGVAFGWNRHPEGTKGGMNAYSCVV